MRTTDAMLLPQSFQPLSAGSRPAGSLRNSLVYNYMEASRDPQSNAYNAM